MAISMAAVMPTAISMAAVIVMMVMAPLGQPRRPHW